MTPFFWRPNYGEISEESQSSKPASTHELPCPSCWAIPATPHQRFFEPCTLKLSKTSYNVNTSRPGNILHNPNFSSRPHTLNPPNCNRTHPIVPEPTAPRAAFCPPSLGASAPYLLEWSRAPEAPGAVYTFDSIYIYFFFKIVIIVAMIVVIPTLLLLLILPQFF